MADSKISALPAATTPLAGTEVLPIVQSGVTDQVTVANLTAGRAVATGALTVTGAASVTTQFTSLNSSTGEPSVAGNFRILLDNVGGVANDTGMGLDTSSYVWTNSGTGFRWTITAAEKMRLTSTGLGIGTTSPDASAILDAQSTTKGVRMPNMTTTQKNAIASPAAGLMVFDTTLAKLCVYSGAAWQTVTSI